MSNTNKIKLQGKNYSEKFKEYSNFVLDGGYKIEENDLNAFRGFWNAFFNSSDGIILIGKNGASKTLTFRLLQKIVHPKSPLFFRFASCLEIVDEYEANGRSCFDKYKNGNWLFDDLGNEPVGNHFSSKIEVIGELIERTYNFRQELGNRYFFTSNLNREMLRQRYGDRAFSRLTAGDMQLFVFGKTSEDKRKLNNFKGFPAVFHEIIKTPEEIEEEKRIQDWYNSLEEREKAPIDREGVGTLIKKRLGIQ